MIHTNLQATPSRAPGLIRMPGPLVNKLLAWGVPMGPNVLVTIRGRVSGEPRTQPLAIFSDEGRRWLIGTFGDTNWCRNLRANPDVEIHHGRHHELLHARELPRAEAERFFSRDLPVGISHLPLVSARVQPSVSARDRADHEDRSGRGRGSGTRCSS